MKREPVAGFIGIPKGPFRRHWYDSVVWRVTVRDPGEMDNPRRIVAENLTKAAALAMARSTKGLRAERIRAIYRSEVVPRTRANGVPVVARIMPRA